MRYRVSIPEPHSHLIRVALEVSHPGDALECVFPVWTPGSYLVREFSRHLECIEADDGAGRRLPVVRLDKHRFRVDAQGRPRCGSATASTPTTPPSGPPTSTAPTATGTGRTSSSTRRGGWEPVEVAVAPPPGWRVSTAMEGGPVALHGA